MKIAVIAEKNQINSKISETFEAGNFLLVYETDDDSYTSFPNPESSRSTGLDIAEKAIQEDCEAVISGSIESIAFEKLALAQITRYDGSGLDIKRAIQLMDENRLEYFRVPRGEEWVPHDHSHQNCDCGVQEDIED